MYIFSDVFVEEPRLLTGTNDELGNEREILSRRVKFSSVRVWRSLSDEVMA